MSLRGACNFHWRGVAVHLARPEPPEQAEAAVLDATERSRAAAFRFEPDRNLYVAAHVFLRHTLSRHAPIAPAEWRFSANAYGKPFITNPGHTSLQFNLSHTDGLIACAISQGQAVGVDVEQCKPMPDLDNLCRYALSAREAEDVLAIHDGAQQVQRFFAYWTLKEAYSKARGMGLSLPLQQFSLIPAATGDWRIQSDTMGTDGDAKWRFLLREIAGAHYLAVALKDEISD